ncbi:MAG: trypsin-like peptidase domain-containing protein [Kiritimatiellaceae bacterium]|nr:trypsin-like peptidase domain-containing protein [Kiritimatiellaceae bacterium]
MRAKIVFVLTCILLPLTGFPIVTANNGMAEQAPPGLNWDYVYNYKSCSSVAVNPYWILTAAHVADDAGDGSLTIGSTKYYQQEIVYHASADLALVRYDKALPGYYGLYAGALYVGDGILMVGYGDTGTVSSASYTDSGQGSGTKRWGSNKIDAGGWLGSTYVLAANFNNGATTNEAGVGVFDSGGGSFFNDAGTWKVVGINIARNPSTPPYTVSYMASMPAYASWVTQTIPEPATGILLVGVGIVFGAIKRLRYMYQ